MIKKIENYIRLKSQLDKEIALIDPNNKQRFYLRTLIRGHLVTNDN